ncbi:MAG: phosphatase PAP2 family protein [Lewinellaceae bacterium]|jgi:membrane-associated phospholipid phosphatase|nr:phosphatase PAP2 family protein [Lewinellaceae bacterium]
MKNIWGNSWFMIPALLFFNGGLLVLYYVSYGDEILYFNDLREEPFNTVFRLITYLGEAYAFFLFGVAAMFWRWRYALLIALTGLITLPTSFIIKDSFGTDRPITYFTNRDMRQDVVTVPGVVLNTGQTSFPSGHSMAAFGLYSMLTLIAGKRRRRLGLLFALTAILVAVSRIFLVQHFLSDILAGALLGLVVSGLVWRLDSTDLFRRWPLLDSGLLPRNDRVA